MSEAFTSLSLKPALLSNLDVLGFHTMTQIQVLTLPGILEGHDLIGQAKTGSGKTAPKKIDTRSIPPAAQI